jgi:hypothetical protein
MGPLAVSWLSVRKATRRESVARKRPSSNEARTRSMASVRLIGATQAPSASHLAGASNAWACLAGRRSRGTQRSRRR